ncbi:diguanylate cyclase [Eionea flava]
MKNIHGEFVGSFNNLLIKHMLNSILDSLDAHLAVIDRSGSICYVNDAWKRFAKNNGMPSNQSSWLEYNYLSVCRSSAASDNQDAKAVLEGLEGVIREDAPFFTYEYPCHSKAERRWYSFHVVPLKAQPNHYLISHQSVTDNKLLLQQAERLSYEDPLTGLNNRRGLECLISKELSRAKRDSHEVSFVIFDIDHFKPFNDRFGHVAGDRCLKTIATILKEKARRPGDIAARIGGDEFVLVLARVSYAQVMLIVNAICQKISDLNMVIDPGRKISLSAGVSTMVPSGNKNNFQEYYCQADDMLYAEKRKRVVLAGK